MQRYWGCTGKVLIKEKTSSERESCGCKQFFEVSGWRGCQESFTAKQFAVEYYTGALTKFLSELEQQTTDSSAFAVQGKQKVRKQINFCGSEGQSRSNVISYLIYW